MSRFLAGVVEIEFVAVAEELAFAQFDDVVDDGFLAFGQGVEPHKVDVVEFDFRGEGSDVFRHIAVGHSGVGALFEREVFAQFVVVGEERVVEVEVVVLEVGMRGALDVPFAELFLLVEISQDLSGVDHVEVDFGEVADHHLTHRDKLFERVEFAPRVFRAAMDVVEFEEEELVRHDDGIAEVGDQFVHAFNAGHEIGFVVLAFEVLFEEESCAAVVEDNQYVAKVAVVFVPNVVGYSV